ARLQVPAPVLQRVVRRGPCRLLSRLPTLSGLFPGRFVPAGQPHAGWLMDGRGTVPPIDWAAVPDEVLRQFAPADLATLLVSLRVTRGLTTAADLPVLPTSQLALWTCQEVAWMYW